MEHVDHDARHRPPRFSAPSFVVLQLYLLTERRDSVTSSCLAQHHEISPSIHCRPKPLSVKAACDRDLNTTIRSTTTTKKTLPCSQTWLGAPKLFAQSPLNRFGGRHSNRFRPPSARRSRPSNRFHHAEGAPYVHFRRLVAQMLKPCCRRGYLSSFAAATKEQASARWADSFCTTSAVSRSTACTVTPPSPPPSHEHAAFSHAWEHE